MITGAAAMSALLASNAEAAQNAGRSDDKTTRTFLELKTWRLHNSEEDQAKRVSEYLESGLFPALTRAGAKPVAALSNLIGPDGPYMFTIVQYPSLAAMQDALAKIAADEAYEKASQKLSSGPGMLGATPSSPNASAGSATPVSLPGRHCARRATSFTVSTPFRRTPAVRW